MLLQILGGERKDGQLETRPRRLVSQKVSQKKAASPATLFFDLKKLLSGRWNIGCLNLKRSGVFV